MLFNYINVYEGDFVHTPVGVIHGGQGGGKISCTFGSNGDLSYRFYDYHRNDPDRPLRIEDTYNLQKFPDVKVSVIKPVSRLKNGLEVFDFYEKQYEYVAKRIKCNAKGKFELNEFMFITSIKGEGFIDNKKISLGETLFIPSNYGEFEISGNLDLILCSYKEQTDVIL